MGAPVVYFEVMGRDRAALGDFYSSLFGWRMSDVPELPYRMVMPGEGDAGIGGGLGTAPDGGEGHATFYVAVDDLPAALERAASLGGSTVLEPMDVPGGQVALLMPDENGGGIGGGVGATTQGDGHVTFYAGVEDVEAALARAESLGATRVMGPAEVGEGTTIGLFRDPEGHMVGVAG